MSLKNASQFDLPTLKSKWDKANSVRHGSCIVLKNGRDRDVLPADWGNRGLSIGQIAKQDGAVAT